MSENTILIIIAIYILIYFIVYLFQLLIYRNKLYFENKHRSRWKQRLITSITSYIFLSIIIWYVFNSNSNFFMNIVENIKQVDIFATMITIFVISFAFIYGSRRIEKLTKDLSPIVRENPIISLLHHPYRNIKQAYKFHNYSHFPSDQELLSLREETRNYTSSVGMWLTVYLLYLLILVEGLLTILIINGNIPIDIPNVITFFKVIGKLLTVGFISFIIISFIVHIPIIRFIEFIGKLFNISESKTSEWTKLVSHSILFIITVVFLFKVLANL